jgi:hypothetical protein
MYIKKSVVIIPILLLLNSCNEGGLGGGVVNPGAASVPSSRQVVDEILKTDPPTVNYCGHLYVDTNNEAFYPVAAPQSKGNWPQDLSRTTMKEIEEKDLNYLLTDKAMDAISERDLKDLECEGLRTATVRERKIFWTMFMASIAVPESHYNSKSVYRERIKRRTYSTARGLLQIGNDDVKRHRCVSTTGKKPNMHNDKDNVRCGLKIMRWQLETAKLSLFDDTKGRSYWSVLRKRNKYGRTKHKTVQNVFKGHLHEMPFCSSEHKLKIGSKYGERTFTKEKDCSKVSKISRYALKEEDTVVASANIPSRVKTR